MRHNLLWSTVAFACLLAVEVVPAADVDTTRPNIVYILADDLGWSELACYGNKFNETQHLDKLAEHSG